jgi:hypothetical protein
MTKSNNTEDIKELIDENVKISDVYSQAFYGDLCQLIAKNNDKNGSLNL